MRKAALLIALLSLTACAGGHMQALESAVIDRANNDPVHAPAYFMYRLESATYEEQAVYMYGIGLAHEKAGDKKEAINDYLAAEAFGYAPATRALQRLGVPPPK
jgi:hypothetical protein